MRWPARNDSLSHGAFNDLLSRDSSIQVLTHYRSALTRTIISEPQRAWGDKVKARLDTLCSLPKGWNGYGAPPVSFANASFALQMLQGCCATTVPVPSIIPGARGDLQIEWHSGGVDIELHVRNPYDVHAWRAMGEDDDGEEVHLTNDFTVVTSWIREMVEPKLAAKASAA